MLIAKLTTSRIASQINRERSGEKKITPPTKARARIEPCGTLTQRVKKIVSLLEKGKLII